MTNTTSSAAARFMTFIMNLLQPPESRLPGDVFRLPSPAWLLLRPQDGTWIATFGGTRVDEGMKWPGRYPG